MLSDYAIGVSFINGTRYFKDKKIYKLSIGEDGDKDFCNYSPQLLPGDKTTFIETTNSFLFSQHYFYYDLKNKQIIQKYDGGNISHEAYVGTNLPRYYTPNFDYTQQNDEVLMSSMIPDESTGIINYILTVRDKNDNIIWYWNAYDHIQEFELSEEEFLEIKSQGLKTNGLDVIPGFSSGNMFHLNSSCKIGKNKWFDMGDKRFDPENILVTSRALSCIFIIDYKTGHIVWKLFGKKEKLFSHAHFAHIIPEGLEGAGNILLLNNEETPTSSAIVEFDPITKEIIFKWDGFYSSFMGSIQKLPSGNYLIGASIPKKIYEVSKEGIVVDEMDFKGKSQFYRAIAFPREWFNEELFQEEHIYKLNRFKESEPKETIKKVLNIMINELETTPFIEYSGNKELNVFSNHVGMEIDSSLTVSGKGTNPLYALASGCGEFMERIQTFFLIVRDFKKPYYADEYDNNGVVMAPYYCYNTGTFEDLSIEEYSLASNGFAAGNTYEEAMVQAMCEILEREAVDRFFNKNLKINSIIQNSQLFEYLRVKELEQLFNARFVFFDVSINKIPICLMVGIRKNNSFVIQFGSAPTMDIACERCVTEFLQGNNGKSDSRFNPVLDFESDPYYDFFFFTMNGRLFLSKKVLDSLFGGNIENEIGFINFKSNADFLNYVIKNKELFGKIYVRDYGFLNFPTVRIIFSNMPDRISERELKFENILKYLNKIYAEMNPSEEMTEYYKGIFNTVVTVFDKKRRNKENLYLQEFVEGIRRKSLLFSGSNRQEIYKEEF